MKKEIATLLVGVILGAALMNLFLCKQIDQLYLEREKLKVELYETTERLKKIRVQQQQNKLFVREIEVIFLNEPKQNLLEIELHKKIVELAQAIIGTEVEKVPHTIIGHLLDQRLIEVNGKKFLLHLKTIIIAEKVTFLLKYETADGQSDE
ncbi:MAG: hypothetical protein GX893_01000 [Firmicutes bacterium]|nr:hypothetical protein [Bacillota bacterium]